MTPLALRDFEAEARRRLDPAIWDYYAGGADDEVTVRANTSAYARIGLVPRVLRGASHRQLAVDVLGHRLSMPILAAPTAFHLLAHPDGEKGSARAVASAGSLSIISMAATTAVEEITEAGRSANPDAAFWFQLYLQPDLAYSQAVIERAEAAGCSALVVTVDSPVYGNRERDRRNGFLDLPGLLVAENTREPLPTGEWGNPRSIGFAGDLSWDHLSWLRTATSLPVVLKGITHPEDARLAVENGAAAIVVSNHGGRQLDTVPATIELLPAIAEAVDARIPVLLDGGIRRGTDVLKALAFGATAVALGRPIVWGLAAGGEQGVGDVLSILRTELDRAMALCGCSSVLEVSRELVRPAAEESWSRL